MSDLYDATVAEIAELPARVRQSPTAALCLKLAAVVESTTAAREIASGSKELRAALADLRAEASATGDQGDLVDELRARREAAAAAG